MYLNHSCLDLGPPLENTLIASSPSATQFLQHFQSIADPNTSGFIRAGDGVAQLYALLKDTDFVAKRLALMLISRQPDHIRAE